MNIKGIMKNHESFESNIKGFIDFGISLISRYSHDKITIDDGKKKILLESFLLRTCAYWENFMEKEILHLIYLDTTNFKTTYGLNQKTNLNQKIIRAIIFSDKYRDFHDIGANKKYFSRILVEKYNPFTNIPKERLNMIDIVYRIRNYLSHYSDYSKNKLMDAYEKEYSYSRFQEPCFFLLKEKGKNFKKLLHNFVLVSVQIKKKIRSK